MHLVNRMKDENTALGIMLERTIRHEVDFDKDIQKVKETAVEQYKKILQNEAEILTRVGKKIENRLQGLANPSAVVDLKRHYDEKSSVIVKNPMARAAVGEGGFIGEVARLGHGMQRAFIVALLQTMAELSGDKQPKLLIGFEEPELYQHPPQAKHLASFLEKMTQGEGANAQVIRKQS